MRLQNRIRIGGYDRAFAEITECHFVIQKLFSGYRFIFTFKITPFEEKSDNPMLMEKLEVEFSYRNGGGIYLIGRMFDDINYEPYKIRGREFSIVKNFDFRMEDFIKLIDFSHHGDLVFEFNTKPVFSVAEFQTRPEIGTLNVPHSDWIRQINAAELDRFELIAIRIPNAVSHMYLPFSESLKKIREAEQQYLRGDWNGAAASCRAAWRTVLSTAPSSTKPIEHLLARITGDPRRKEFATALLKGLHDIQNKAVHLEGDVKNGVPAADITPEDALLCIHWYSALIGYLSSV